MAIEIKSPGDFPAFPAGEDDSPGVSYRQYVATHVLAALVAQGDYRSTPHLLAANAVGLADALLEELSRRK